jgi:hypothetical protein
MDSIEIALIIENENKKCLNTIKKYYQKYGNDDVEKLYNYLCDQLSKTDDKNLIYELNEDIEILKDYMKIENL